MVLFQRAYFPIAKTKICFEFEHPISDIKLLNQTVSIQFDFNESCEIHGFAGYFSSVLYNDIVLSIEPNTYTPELFSWFPIFFPSNV